MVPDRALSVQQPWAWCIVNGYKDIENRDWKTKFWGIVYIHAGKKFDQDGYDFIRQTFPNIPLPKPEEFQRGGIVGMVSIRNCVTYHPSPWFFGKFGFVLANAVPLPFRAYKGALGFFKVGENANG